MWKFRYDTNRMDHLDGIFVATREELEELVGDTLYFGEVLGKHSGVQVEFSMDYVTKVTDDSDFAEKFEQYGCTSGFNPLDYKPESEEEETPDYHLYQYGDYIDYWAGECLDDVMEAWSEENDGKQTETSRWRMVPDDKLLKDANKVVKMACEHAQDYFDNYGKPGCTDGFGEV